MQIKEGASEQAGTGPLLLPETEKVFLYSITAPRSSVHVMYIVIFIQSIVTPIVFIHHNKILLVNIFSMECYNDQK